MFHQVFDTGRCSPPPPGSPYRVDTYTPVQSPRPVEVLMDDDTWAAAMLYSWSPGRRYLAHDDLWRSADLLRTYHTAVIYSRAALRTVSDKWWEAQQQPAADATGTQRPPRRREQPGADTSPLV
ncbi:hypothetical protein GCM10009530_20500 [Microbispora corallina]|uniref:Uncharacterized protein n=1 Tax=Microbispora corallina TaxID=83302 RepID=A0ABQ4FU04_9ACTN|nr:hypothetical protein Mco01_12900 [Microbispora corallina]